MSDADAMLHALREAGPMSVERHYETLLAAHYTWMAGGDFAAKVGEQTDLLAALGVTEAGDAIDLGCGPGFQSIALARLGARCVTAIDTSATLLAELHRHAAGLPIRTLHADIRDLPRLTTPASARTIVCMGDTLAHLPSHNDVVRLLAAMADALQRGGRIVLTLRDLSVPLSGVDRFIPVRADAARIMTCALNYDADGVTVTDLIHVREAYGWRLHKGSYRKLRLDPAKLAAALSRHGLVVTCNAPAGRLHAIAAMKPG